MAAQPADERSYIFCLKIDTDNIAATKVHALALGDLHTGKVYSCTDSQPKYHPIADGITIATQCDGLIVHSRYAVDVLTRLYGADFSNVSILDTLAVARTRWPSGNGLADFAKRLKLPRSEYRGGANWSPAVQAHAERDAKILLKVYEHLVGGDA